MAYWKELGKQIKKTNNSISIHGKKINCNDTNYRYWSK